MFRKRFVLGEQIFLRAHKDEEALGIVILDS